jgi:hypothetical protein
MRLYVAGPTLVALAFASAALQSQPTTMPAAPLRAASQPPVNSPAVQAAEEARSPELRPEHKPVPQIQVPLKRKSQRDDAATAAAPWGRTPVDDEVARCRASKEARERAACSALTQGRKPPAEARPSRDS